MWRADTSGKRRNGRIERRRLGRRWMSIVAALALALVVILALGSADTASAASHRKHSSHPSHSSHQTTPSTPAFALDFTCAQAWDKVLGVVCVKTQPGAALTIGITYCGHTAGDASLKGTVHADSKGQYVWNWMPNTTCRTGRAAVTATAGGKTVKNSTTFPIAAEPGV